MKKVLISVAPVSATDREIIPEKIATDVINSYKEGASMVHLHVRDRKGNLTPDVSVLEETVRLIRRESDMIIQASTGGVSNLTIAERCTPVSKDWVEANSLNVGSVNLGEAVYSNPPADVRYCVEQILKYRKIPEIEVFEIGMIKTVADLSEKYDFIKPILFSVVLGHIGAAPATRGTLQSMLKALEEFFPNQSEILWGITHANRKDFDMIRYALQQGAATVRIGFEDSDYVNETIRVTENAELVKEVVKICKQEQIEPMTPSEARKMLGMKSS